MSRLNALLRKRRKASFRSRPERERMARRMKRRYTLPVLLLVFAVLAVGIVTAGGLLYRSQRDSCRTEAEHKLAAVADLKVSELSAVAQGAVSRTPASSIRTVPFPLWCGARIERPQDLPLQEELRTWIGRFQASYRL